MNFNALEDYDEMQLHSQLMHQSQTIIKLSVYVAVLTASYLLSLAYLWHRNWPSHLTIVRSYNCHGNLTVSC